jgi:hypothetical protein
MRPQRRDRAAVRCAQNALPRLCARLSGRLSFAMTCGSMDQGFASRARLRILDPGRHRLVEPVKAGLGQCRGLHMFGSAVAFAYSGRPAVRYVWMVMPREVVRELTSSSAMSGPESENSRVPWPMMTG